MHRASSTATDRTMDCCTRLARRADRGYVKRFPPVLLPLLFRYTGRQLLRTVELLRNA